MVNITAAKNAGRPFLPRPKKRRKHKSHMRRTERRQYPRINTCLPLEVSANGYDFSTTTKNISCVGAYCHVNKYIPPFTKVKINLTLPITDKEACQVGCNGVVVRTADENSGGFNIAVFFNEIRENQRKKISAYLKQFLPQKSPSFARA